MFDRNVPLAIREAAQVLDLTALLFDTLVDIIRKNPELSLHVVRTSVRALADDATILGQLSNEPELSDGSTPEMVDIQLN